MSVFGWAFTAPMLLWGLLALPILWLILRAIPPAPLRRRFPAVILLLGLTDDTKTADRTPWWLLLLRALAIAAAIIGFAGPLRAPLNAVQSDLPLLIVMDGGWAEAHDWQAMRAIALDGARRAGRAGRLVAAVQITAPPAAPNWQSADALMASLAAAAPAPFAPSDFARWADALGDAPFDTLWLSDGLDHANRSTLLLALQTKGAIEVVLPRRPTYALGPATFEDGEIEIPAVRFRAATAAEVTILAIGAAPNAAETELGRTSASFAAGAGAATARMSLPPELRNRISRFEIEGQRSAGAISLTDDSLKRRKVAIIGATSDAEGLRLLSPTHYLTTALAPSSDLLLGGIMDVLPSVPDTIILADVGKISAGESDALLEWISGGGTLLRFAGPRLAASDFDEGDDALLPVRLRAGGRTAGGAMTWGSAMQLAPFKAASPFAGLRVGDDVTVTAQVLAQPGPDLAAATLAALSDGTPLVTRRKLGAGQIVLFHTTANAEWTNLPLSGLFIQMLERLAVASRTEPASQEDVIAGLWQPQRLTGAFGGIEDGTQLAGLDGAALWRALQTGPMRGAPAGLYASDTRKVALNVMQAGAALTAFSWPSTVTLRGADAPPPADAKGPLLVAALMLLALDIMATLFVGGKLGVRAALLLVAAVLITPVAPTAALAQGTEVSDFAALRATRGVVLAHVITGDAEVDAIAKAGLLGLGDVLTARTSIEPEPPISVDIETDILDFFPFLYWPISPNQDLPSPAAVAKLNRFMRTGGMIMFDTRTGDLGADDAQNMLQLVTMGLDIPPLDPVPQDHVLARSFYLIGGFPGRHEGPPVWVEASPETNEDAPEGMPFRNLNDGVSPVIIGSNDWAGAWAVDEWGNALLPVGRGFAGEEQREYAFRFGVNVIMHVLTGNYKSDQVHVPALLDRLGQ
jgi:hypothetical protein